MIEVVSESESGATATAVVVAAQEKLGKEGASGALWLLPSNTILQQLSRLPFLPQKL